MHVSITSFSNVSLPHSTYHNFLDLVYAFMYVFICMYVCMYVYDLLKWAYILLIRILLRGVIMSHVYASISAYVKIYPYLVILILLNW